MQKEVGKGIDEKTYQKFCWHMNFVNSELDRKNDKKDRKYRLSMILEDDEFNHKGMIKYSVDPGSTRLY